MQTHTIASYYDINAVALTGVVSESEYLEQFGVRVLTRSEAETVPFYPLYDIHQDRSLTHALPLRESHSIIIPGDRNFHEESLIDGVSIKRGIDDHINEVWHGSKYLLNSQKRFFFALQIDNFSSDILGLLSTSPSSLILFSDLNTEQVIFDEDLEITIFTQQPAEGSVRILGRDEKFWNSYFREHFPKEIIPNQAHLAFFNAHYADRLPGIGRLAFPSGA